jgi:plasmid stability protein
MTNRLTIELPDLLYERVKQRAEIKNHTIEDEVIEAVSSAITDNNGVPPELDSALKDLETLNDKALWKIARTKMPSKDVKKIHNLHYKRQDTDLTDQEKQLLANLMADYDQYILMRAKAAAVLHKRGYDVSVLIEK